MSKFVGILDLLAVAGVVFALERDGGVLDSVDLGLGVLVIVGLQLASRKFSVSFTLRLLLWSGVFLPILKNQLRKKSVVFLERKRLLNRSVQK